MAEFDILPDIISETPTFSQLQKESDRRVLRCRNAKALVLTKKKVSEGRQHLFALDNCFFLLQSFDASKEDSRYKFHISVKNLKDIPRLWDLLMPLILEFEFEMVKLLDV